MEGGSLGGEFLGFVYFVVACFVLVIETIAFLSFAVLSPHRLPLGRLLSPIDSVLEPTYLLSFTTLTSLRSVSSALTHLCLDLDISDRTTISTDIFLDNNQAKQQQAKLHNIDLDLQHTTSTLTR